jgi:hypothetical protein
LAIVSSTNRRCSRDRRADRLRGGVEDAERLVAAKLHDPAAAVVDDRAADSANFVASRAAASSPRCWVKFV